MTRYIGIIDGEDGAYGVVFPDLPGCTSAGATADEAAHNAVDAVSLWVADAIASGETVPRARTLAEITADDYAMADVRTGRAALIAV
ncbi:MAG: HicB family protein [Xanthobacteraceae bacterium]|nr:MAG: HicB family protein [Xanthobacteraceae bacterium]